MTIVFTAGAIIAYDPARGLIARRGGGGGMTSRAASRHWRWVARCVAWRGSRCCAARAARSGLAVPADQGAAAFARGGLGWSAGGSAAGRLAAGPACRRPGARDRAAPRAARAGAGQDPRICRAGEGAEAGETAGVACRAVQRAGRGTQLCHCWIGPIRRAPEGTRRGNSRRQRKAADDAGGSDVRRQARSTRWCNASPGRRRCFRTAVRP